jgi:hypothetical protein
MSKTETFGQYLASHPLQKKELERKCICEDCLSLE